MSNTYSKRGRAGHRYQSVSWLMGAVVSTWIYAAGAQTLFEFKFDEGSGPTVASTVNGLVGTLGAIVDPLNDPEIVPDSPSGSPGDTSVRLQNQGFLVAQDAPETLLNLVNDAFTIEAWVRMDEVRQYGGIVSYGSAYKMCMYNDRFRFTLLGIVDIDSPYFMPIGEWHHLATVWQPGVGVTFFVDGIEYAFVEETRSIRAPLNNYLFIGSEAFGNNFVGCIDRVRVHKEALTAADLDADPMSTRPLRESTVVAYDFNETSMPFHSSKTPDRPLKSINSFLEEVSKPVFTTDTPSGKAGDYALEFRQGNRVTVPDPMTVLALDPADPSFTIESWVKFDSTPGSRAVLFFNNCPGGAITFSVTLDRRVFVTTLGIADTTSSAFIPADGGWHHIAVMHEHGKELRFYVDGQLGATVAYNRGVIFTRTDNKFYFGSEAPSGLNPSGNLPFVGKLDRIRYTKGLLRPDQLDFWPIPGVEPAPPALKIMTAVQLAWPTIPAGYKLQQTTSLEEPIQWTDVPNAPLAMDLNWNVFLPTSPQRMYYRLVKP